ncbi:hypothetical protein J6590_050946 [Homalodisca vitripennis]|nr:hypothetical protein J6590_050946 [Homalodisca vitripennis]
MSERDTVEPCTSKVRGVSTTPGETLGLHLHILLACLEELYGLREVIRDDVDLVISPKAFLDVVLKNTRLVVTNRPGKRKPC